MAFDTVSSESNMALIEYVRDLLLSKGIESLIVKDESGRKANLFASTGPRDVPGILLSGHTDVVDIQDAYHLLDPLVGGALASMLFGVALLASGQSSTFTGTIAGQVIMEGYLNLRIPCWQRRLLTRGLALIPAFIGVWLMGDGAVGKLLVMSQVVLSLQLPFALYPLIRMTSDKQLMGPFVNRWPTRVLVWGLFVVISAANSWLILQLLA